MGWLSKLFNTVPKEELEGAHLDLLSPFWELSGDSSFCSLLNSLIAFIPSEAFLYFEGGSPSKEISEFMKKKAVPEQLHINMGTIWPRPKIFHVPASKENLEKLARIMDHHADPELASHFHVYLKGKVILEWYDAFSDSMSLSGDWPEEKVSMFCCKLGWKYKTISNQKVEQRADK